MRNLLLPHSSPLTRGAHCHLAPAMGLGSAWGRDAQCLPQRPLWGQRANACCCHPSAQHHLPPWASPSNPGTFTDLGRVWWWLEEEEAATHFQAALSLSHLKKVLGTAAKGLDPSQPSSICILPLAEGLNLAGCGSSSRSICFSWKQLQGCLRDENTSSAAPPPPDIWESRATALWSFTVAIRHEAQCAQRREAAAWGTLAPGGSLERNHPSCWLGKMGVCPGQQRWTRDGRVVCGP